MICAVCRRPLVDRWAPMCTWCGTGREEGKEMAEDLAAMNIFRIANTGPLDEELEARYEAGGGGALNK